MGSNPRALRATLSSFDSIVPDPLVSNKSNASLISYFCCSDSSCLYGFFFFLTYFSGSAPVAAFVALAV